MSKLNKLEKFLKSGATATPRQITGMFGLANPSAAIYELRSRGNLIYANSSKLADGTATTRYKIGKPSRKMVQVIHALGMLA
jgi:hypothetical protein